MRVNAPTSYRIHTRFVVTPTGPLHIVHALVAWLNKVLAVGSGGTFTIRFETVLAANSLREFREGRQEVCWQNLAELEALGLGPSPAAHLRARGLPPGCGLRYQEGNGVTGHYYRLWGLEDVYGPWPPLGSEEAVNNFEAVYLAGPSGVLAEHPYVILNRVVDDITTGRNVIIRGDDLRGETALYLDFAYRILHDRGKLPRLYYIPEVVREVDPAKAAPCAGGPKPEYKRLSSSGGAGVNGSMTIADLLRLKRGKMPKSLRDEEKREAWLTADNARIAGELVEFFGRHLTVDGAWPGKLGAGGPESLLVSLLDRPVLRDIDWDEFLKGKV